MDFRKIEAVDIMRYYVTYNDIEKQILLDVHSNSFETRDAALGKYMNNHMRIGRNFKATDDSKDMIFNITNNFFKYGDNEIEVLSNLYFEKKLLNNKISNAKVAASKLLWLFDQEIIIMDNFNKSVLDVKTENYSDYISKWKSVFDIKVKEIDNVIKQYNFDKIDPIINEQWFKMRVFDQYLWTIKAGK